MQPVDFWFNSNSFDSFKYWWWLEITVSSEIWVKKHQAKAQSKGGPSQVLLFTIVLMNSTCVFFLLSCFVLFLLNRCQNIFWYNISSWSSSTATCDKWWAGGQIDEPVNNYCRANLGLWTTHIWNLFKKNSYCLLNCRLSHKVIQCRDATLVDFRESRWDTTNNHALTTFSSLFTFLFFVMFGVIIHHNLLNRVP